MDVFYERFILYLMRTFSLLLQKNIFWGFNIDNVIIRIFSKS
ncbi:hypothetical protein J2Z23_001224 [Lederbergia galactosidilyticus]|nr:hypothetical protein [Lederbergia galactosidilytica]